MTLAIETSGLLKHFGSTRAVDGIDLRVERGTVYGLLGPNGAGKTTTIRVLATLLRPSGGVARVLGHDVAREPARVREKVCLTGQFASVDEDLTGHENLVLVARLFGYGWAGARARADELLGAFDLTEAAGKQVREYSGGMRRRLDIAASLVVTPEVLFLDEPTSGLDPRSRNQVWDIVRTIAAEGTTVLLTTQYLEEADRLAHRLAVIDHGRLIAEGTSRELKSSVGSNTLLVRLEDSKQRPQAQAILLQVLGAGVHAGSDADTLAGRVDPLWYWLMAAYTTSIALANVATPLTFMIVASPLLAAAKVLPFAVDLGRRVGVRAGLAGRNVPRDAVSSVGRGGRLAMGWVG